MRRLTTGATTSRMSSAAMPHGAITALYADEANNEALKQFICLPGRDRHGHVRGL